MRANLAGVLSRIGNATIVNLAGEQIRFKGELGMGAGEPIILRNTTITSPRLNARLDSKVVTGGGVTLDAPMEATYAAFGLDPAQIVQRLGAGKVLLKPLYPGVTDNAQLGREVVRDLVFTAFALVLDRAVGVLEKRLMKWQPRSGETEKV